MAKLREVTLEDKYTVDSGTVYLTGNQALVRLPIMQRQRDLAAGLNTAGFISGYRGSPIGGYDLALWDAAKHLEAHHIHFQPGVNEDLAATAVWGTQQLGMIPAPKYDGVFAIWYGKGPGVDRSGDPLKHGNLSGAAKNGGVLVVFGDDHPAKSSTVAHQSEQAISAASIPILYPATVQDYIDLGLFGWAMSRYSGCWVGFKTVNETIEGTATVDVDPSRFQYVEPEDAGTDWSGISTEGNGADINLQRVKLPRARQFARANRIDRITLGDASAKFGIVAAGKTYLDVYQALQILGIDDAKAREVGVALYKVAMVFPLEPEGLTEFSRGKDELLIVEEKKAFIEPQAASILYNLSNDVRPRITGKFDEQGAPQQPPDVQLDPQSLADLIVTRLRVIGRSDELTEERLSAMKQVEQHSQPVAGPVSVRIPYFCAGCPHNSSTCVPEGSMAMSGIGCHTMAIWMGRRTLPPTQMGGEGLNWTGIAPFTNTPHIFQNLGDGTYYHSGLLAIRGAINSGANITYKILLNDAVAMTGGQPVEGGYDAAEISRQILAEGARRVVVVTDDPGKYGRSTRFAPGVEVHHRDRLDRVQRELREITGVTALVYDQVCAAEKRRRRKRGLMEDPDERVFINPAVCEGCGDCSVQSNCVAVVPLETAWGRKRAIDQSNCNKDMSCLKGFCPALVTVKGGTIRNLENPRLPEGLFDGLPDPEPPRAGTGNILITGIGGSGVVTIGAVLGMAAHLEEKGATVFDMTGLAQKGGAVLSHLRITERPGTHQAPKIGAGEADLILGCDLVVTASPDVLHAVRWERTHAVVNSHLTPTAAFQANPDIDFRGDTMVQRLVDTVGQDNVSLVQGNEYAMGLLGNTLATNMFVVGYALQKGLLPLSVDSVTRAIELNGVSVEFNRNALHLGRLAATDPAALDELLGDRPAETDAERLDTMIDQRAQFLTGYQNAAYAEAFRRQIEAVKHCEQELVPGSERLTRAVTHHLSRLMAYKDEYEVARLHTGEEFRRVIERVIEGDYRLEYHLAPPLVARPDRDTGRPRKIRFGNWFTSALKLLSLFKGIRGSAIDPFGLSGERKLERQLLADFRHDLERVLESATAENLDAAIALIDLYGGVKGFGHVKAANYGKVKPLLEKQRAEFTTQHREAVTA